ncbi:helix-turn-helix domain-containing protein [Cellulosimicrobium cellulans]|uniref:helix-turn-helix domain-containing protein n=1 Tax=Cellulosimicrobium cellulans TaxID=1710 RepID=UPI0036643A59
MSQTTLLTTRDAADRLGVSVPTVTRLVRSGDLTAEAKAPGARGAYLFTAEAVDALLAERSAS